MARVVIPESLAASGKYEEFAQGPGKRHGRSNSLKWPWLYDKLRAKGYDKSKAAAISNSRLRYRKKGRLSVLQAKQAHSKKVLNRLAAADKAGTHATKGKLTKGLRLSANHSEEFMAFIETIDFACMSKACAPPPVGTGGSKSSAGASSAEALARKSYSAGYKAGQSGSYGAVERADKRGANSYWYTGFYDADAGHPKGRGLRETIKASEARGDSRPVSYNEFQRFAGRGQEQLDGFKKNASPTTGLDQNMAKLKADTFKEVQNEWGGATIDSHTGKALPQGVDKYAITVKDKGVDTVSIPVGASQKEFDAAMDTARERFGSILEREQHHLGVFRDDAVGRIGGPPRHAPCAHQRLALERAHQRALVRHELRAHVDDALVPGGDGLDPDHLRARPHGVARVARAREAHVDVREVGDRPLAHVVHAEREAEVQEQERVNGATGEADGAGCGAARVGRGRVLERGGEEGEHALVERDIPGVSENGSRDEVVEVPAVVGGAEHRFRGRASMA